MAIFDGMILIIRDIVVRFQILLFGLVIEVR